MTSGDSKIALHKIVIESANINSVLLSDSHISGTSTNTNSFAWYTIADNFAGDGYVKYTIILPAN